MVANFVRVLRLSDVRQYISAELRNCSTDPTVHSSSTRGLSFDGQMIAAGVETDCRNSVKIARPTVVSAMHFTFKPNTHRRRQRDSTVELSRVELCRRCVRARWLS